MLPLKPTQYLPCLLIVIDVGAAVVCFWYGDVRRGIYWLSAATLTSTVTF